MRKNILLLLLIIFQFQSVIVKAKVPDVPPHHRILVSSDIGGTDFDDFQSMVHLLVYADTFDIEGIISSPFGDGRAEHIFEVIDSYKIDYPKLKSYSVNYPTADSLRKIVKQGAIYDPGPIGYADSTEGSNWIVECARRSDPRPLNILIWGGIEDLAQALHDAPDILPKLRVYYIGGPNKKWSVNAYQYIADNFPDLWMIEANATYRGWFLGGDQSGIWSNSSFVTTYVKGFGALGDYFYSKGGQVKLGDTPSLMRLFYGTPDDPSQPSWGGKFVRAWERPHKVFYRTTTSADSIEQFGVLELILPADIDTISNPVATLNIDRVITGLVENDTARFLFSPKDGNVYSYSISSNIPSINGLTGSITAYRPPASNILNPSPLFPNWWTDDPSSEYIESGYIGVKTLNIWRVDFLSDFADRMYRCEYFYNTYFKLNTSAINGIINRSIDDTAYLAGSKITLTAIPDSGYEFLQWEGDITGTSPEITVTLNSDKNIIARFTPATSINDYNYDKISVFPTIINDFVNVSVPGCKKAQKHIALLDSSGKLLHTYLLGPDQDNLLINTSDLLPGVFIIQIIDGTLKYNRTVIKT
ncbi:MAG: DUF1593 domain-containing protein [Bacteroidales bacterium]|nr:DUF1593 domain-containing protein [Bacteroidales bacterium]